MPTKLKKPCKGRFNTCPNTVPVNEKYCPQCAPREKQRERERVQEYDRQRGTAQERGYDARWNRVSRLYRRSHPICEYCEKNGIVTPAEEVHHIVPVKEGGDKYSFANLMSLCRMCHNQIEPRWHMS